MVNEFEEIEIGTQKYTKVFREKELKFNAPHEYRINSQENLTPLAKINFQLGPIKENGVNGIHHEDLICIIIDRLNHFQNSEYKCRENALAITKLEEALHWLNQRTSGREKRGVEGTSQL